MRNTKRCIVYLAIIFAALSFMHNAYAFSGEVTSVYGWRIHPIFGIGKGHEGIDVAVPAGVGVPSLVTGTVVYSGWCGGYGYVISVQDSMGVCWNMGHNSQLLYPVGTHVEQGQVIAISGSTGNSTGPHVHVERRLLDVFGDTTDPLDYVASQWDLSGWDPNNSTGVFGNIVPNIDFDFSNYFAPSEELLKVTKKILELLKPALDFVSENLVELMISLFVIDLAVYLLTGVLGVRPIKDFSELIPKIMRYGFFFWLLQSWHWLVSNMFVPMIENISSTYSGQSFSESSFLQFEAFFTSVTHLIKPFLHINEQFSFLTQLLLMILVPIILTLCLFVTFYMVYKLVVFYIMCVFGALGIPLMIYSKTEYYGKNLISAVFTAIFDLIVSAFIYSIVIDTLNGFKPLTADSVATFVVFVLAFTFLVWMVPILSTRVTKHFNALLNN